jgi:phage gp36-like protein
MTYTTLTRTIAGLISGEVGIAQVGNPILFMMNGITYFGTIESIGSMTSIVLLASSALPITNGTVTSIEVLDVSGHYCSQSDLEARIGVLQLAQLTNDTAGATIADAVVVQALIEKSDREIDSKAGQVYTTPFMIPTNCTSIPSLIKQISIDYSIYYCFNRRFSTLEVPKQWIEIYKSAQEKLDDVSNLLVQLDGDPTLFSVEADMVANNIPIDFNDTNSPMSMF